MAGGMIESRASGEAAGYLQNAQLFTIVGIILIVVGGALILFYGKKKR
jgi:LPXTG-motif cell wall-anchored protein